ncbi:UNVERIFIED_CONTAM: hypothetical protein GTU68_042800 [Idotea baltica]|nr:hypothetical protein [Idotea baltica]
MSVNTNPKKSLSKPLIISCWCTRNTKRNLTATQCIGSTTESSSCQREPTLK